MRGEPNPNQWEMYAKNNCVFQYHMPADQQFMRNWNQPYLDFAKDKGWRQRNDPVQLAIYSDTLQSFRLAAQGKTRGRQPPERLRARIEQYFDPLPFWYPPLEDACTDTEAFPLAAITQRPMAMYHSWDSQNAWLRQIHSHNYLHVNPLTAGAAGIADGGWCWVESKWGRVRCMVRYSEAVEPNTVWTWNAIGKRSGAWNLSPDARETTNGFLLNHAIAEFLPGPDRVPNADPITGQAAWYDLRIRLEKCRPDEIGETVPHPPTLARPPGLPDAPRILSYNANKSR
jgi:anaerobic selenocysteine-containing dehydrogenase